MSCIVQSERVSRCDSFWEWAHKFKYLSSQFALSGGFRMWTNRYTVFDTFRNELLIFVQTTSVSHRLL